MNIPSCIGYIASIANRITLGKFPNKAIDSPINQSRYRICIIGHHMDDVMNAIMNGTADEITWKWKRTFVAERNEMNDNSKEEYDRH